MASRNASFPLFSTTVISCSTGFVARHGHFGAREVRRVDHIGPRDKWRVGSGSRPKVRAPMSAMSLVHEE